MHPPTSYPSDSSGTALKPGDRVKVDTPDLPDLTFIIDYLTDELGQPLACGPYGCFAVDLLLKIHESKCS